MKKALTTAVLLTLLFAVSALPARADAPAAPARVTRARISDAQVKITWLDRSSDEEGFEILRRAVTEVEFESRGSVGADVTEFIDDAPKGTIYIYEVVAFNADGDSTPSNICYVNRQAPPAPDSFQVKLIALTIVDLVWSDRARGEKGYEVQRANFGKPFRTIARLDANTEYFRDDTLEPVHTYTYRVRAIGRTAICWDNSQFTSERTVTTVGGVKILQVEPRGGGKGMVVSDPPGISCGTRDDHCTAKFPVATYVKLYEKPGANSRFGGWANYSPCEGRASVCTVRMGIDRVIGAAFRVIP